MSKDFFNKMDKEEKADFINSNLNEGMSFKDIYDATMHSNELIKSKQTLLNQFKKAGYRVNDNNLNHKIMNITASESQDPINNSSLNTFSNDNLLTVLQQSEDILQMLDWWKNIHYLSPQEDSRLTIPIPCEGDEIRKTIRINNLVWEKWKEFCGQQPGYSEKDLFAKALLFFMKHAD